MSELRSFVGFCCVRSSNSTQHTAHSTQHTAHSTQHTAHTTQHTAQHTADNTRHSTAYSTAQHSTAIHNTITEKKIAPVFQTNAKPSLSLRPSVALYAQSSNSGCCTSVYVGACAYCVLGVWVHRCTKHTHAATHSVNNKGCTLRFTQHTYPNALTQKHPHTNTKTPTRQHKNTHHTQTHTHKHTHTHTHTHKHTHIHTPGSSPNRYP